MSTPTITRWVNLNSPEFQAKPDYKATLRFTLRAVELGAITADKDGRLCYPGGFVNDTINGEVVGVRMPEKAAN
jgi:hypothetical protein